MMRFFVGCLILAVACVALVLFGGPYLFPEHTSKDTKFTPPWEKKTDDDKSDDHGFTSKRTPERHNEDSKVDEEPVDISDTPALARQQARDLVIPDARLLPTQKADISSEREGKILTLATEAADDEDVPKDKLIEHEFARLYLEVSRAEYNTTPARDRREFQDKKPGGEAVTRYYRVATNRDELLPGQTQIFYQKIRLRKLDRGDRVKAGQMLAIVNPSLALDEMKIKQAGLDAAESERRATVATKEEAIRRVKVNDQMRVAMKRAVNEDEYQAAKLAVVRYSQEEVAKGAAVRKSSRELAASLTTLKMHQIRAAIDGEIRHLFKRGGEAVKNNEPVLQLVNPDILHVEAQVEVQDAQELQERMKKAQAYLLQAERDKKAKDLTAYTRNRQRAEELLRVRVDVSRLQPPQPLPRGHLQEINAVAVSKGPMAWIVSAGEDGTVRLWERLKARTHWQEKHSLDHRAPVRALACTPPSAKDVNLLITGTSTGLVRLFDLGDLKGTEVRLKGRHEGGVTALAFSPDGAYCVTGGTDRSICLYQVKTRTLLGRVKDAHSAAITSLMFTKDGKVISAGRDKRLMVWKTAEGGDEGKTLVRDGASIDKRSGEVAQLGVDPTGTRVLFDAGRELRVLSLDKNREITGTLQNGPGAASFATLALFSPDGSTILTNGSGVGKLQLWRAPNKETARAAEIRQLVWSHGMVTCAAFDPAGEFIVAGTSDNRVLVWQMPSKAETEKPLTAALSYVEEFLETSLKRVTIRADLGKKPDWLQPGSTATIVVPE